MERALGLYARAAEADDTLAMLYLANMYFAGRGTTVEPEKASALYRRAAEAGSASAACHYAYCLEKGIGLEKDPAGALEWYRRAADEGDATAAYNFAVLTENGTGCRTDPALAAQYYEKAYTLGDQKAAGKLAELYRTGRGVKRDRKKAAEWSKKGGRDEELQKQRQRSNAVGHWMLRVTADASLVGCFFAGFSGFSTYDRQDLIGAAYLATLALMFHALAWYMRPKPQKHLPRAVHVVLFLVLLTLLLAILSVLLAGGVTDPEDIWILGWLAALTALSAWRAFRKRS